MAIKISGSLEALETIEDTKRQLKLHLGEQYDINYRIAGFWYEKLFYEFEIVKSFEQKVFLFFKNKHVQTICWQNFNKYKDKDFRISKKIYISLKEVDELMNFIENRFGVDLVII